MSIKIQLKLEPQGIALGDKGLLKHQQETVDALKKFPIVMNCAMTGAGKTKASHLGVQVHAYDKPVLFVAPTNALVSQHLEDAKEFVKNNNLPHKVIAVDGSILSKLQRKSSSLHRSSAVLHQIIYNPRAFAEEFGIDDKSGPLWLISNPDQIWMSIVQGRDIDTRNLLQDFINKFRFVVVDEFHYYTAEQLVLFFLCVAFWKHFGQFDDGLKMLLLTATPDELVENFFTRLGFPPCIVGNKTNGNEKTIPVLAPVDLTLTTGCLNDYKDFVINNYNQGKDGVIISDSLFEVNKAYKEYNNLNISVGRITGPIKNRQRKSESQKRLILATPTVDLGFNFIKPHPKDRQEIDFLLSTVRNQSSFWQRLGRAGRVLGREKTDVPSQAVILLPDSGCFKSLIDFDKREITRSELKNLLNLRDKQLKGSALTREGLYTATHQLIEIKSMLPESKKSIVEDIFNTLKTCLDPNNLTSDWSCFSTRHWLSRQFKELNKEYKVLMPYHITEWLNCNEKKGKSRYSEPMEVLLGSWAKNYFYKKGQLEQYNEYVKQKDRLSLIKPLLKKKKSAKKEIIFYLKEQMLRLNYLFNFRGSNSKEQVWIYDPGHLYSSHTYNNVNLVTLLSKYHFNGPFPQAAAEKNWNVSLPKADMFFELTDFQDYPFRPVFEFNGELPKRPADLEHKESNDADILPCYWQTVTLHDLSLKFQNNKKGPLHVPADIKSKLTGLSEIFYITPIEDQFILSNWLKEYDVMTGTLMVQTKNGTLKPHSVVYGKDAILISEELLYRKKNELC